MKEKIINGLRIIVSYILKPFAVCLSFAFAMGRAYERAYYISKGYRYGR